MALPSRQKAAYCTLAARQGTPVGLSQRGLLPDQHSYRVRLRRSVS